MASSNGGVPPGFRFHPTDEELLHYYLKKKLSFQKFDMEVIREVDLNKIEPWELQEKCRIGSTPQNEWYFFSHKDRKYPTGSRTNRATNAGFWKATGRDKCIRNTYKKIGMRKTLVFYRGRAPHGQKTDWIMHEYRLEDGDDSQGSEDGWVVCRVFKKKNLFKVPNEGGSSSSMNSSDQQLNTSSTNPIQPRTFMHRDTQYHNLLRHQNIHQHNFELDKPTELALHPYPHIPTPQYTLFQSQPLLPSGHKPLNYDYSVMPNPRDCESASENLRYQACDPGLEVNTCEANQQMVGGRSDESMNEWAMLDRLVTPHLGNEDSSKGGVRFDQDANANSSVHPMNQPSLRGEMDFWNYGK
ncbi:hypothetical protein SLEP1_g20716 [Rubroshorea leprosula]|uniref:NAC domain-containing protein n=1 Tax=Rubroshorea leprosula TaxID=152421 RepID=A0AAV5J3K6_9ROSI|nr:hypothetical protein SLEP1_g20716 [Rubroshorea leprosula]